jgi:hypothetical protein
MEQIDFFPEECNFYQLVHLFCIPYIFICENKKSINSAIALIESNTFNDAVHEEFFYDQYKIKNIVLDQLKTLNLIQKEDFISKEDLIIKRQYSLNIIFYEPNYILYNKNINFSKENSYFLSKVKHLLDKIGTYGYNYFIELFLIKLREKSRIKQKIFNGLDEFFKG